jgi:TrmH family RNA methyltransferase
MLTSLQNEKVKLAHLLQTQAKARRREGKIVLEGVRLIRDAIEQGLQPHFVLYTPNPTVEALVAELEQQRLIAVSDDVMRHVSDTQQPQGIAGVFPVPQPALPKQPERVLILDAIRDPGNMGAMLRTAAGAGVQAVLLSPDSVDPYNPKTLRGGMGAHFRVPVVERSWDDIAAYCQGLTVYLADSKGDVRHDQADWSSAWALIIGSEAHGASDMAQRLAHARVFIPLATETESLNAAVAAGVILFEAMRQARVW